MEKQRRSPFNLEEIKVRWKKAALENCPGVPCVTVTVPGAPTGVTATAGNASASVSFTAPSNNGGSAITGYTVTSSPGNITGTGSASPITVSGLTNGTAYTFTVVATNSVGSSAASTASTSVTPSAIAPTLSTTTISSITATGAAGGGNITSDGGAAVTARGVVWSTSSAPTVSLSTKTTDGSGTGTFTSTLASLTASTTYYVRAYATNSVGTAYGNEVTFITSAPAIPTLSTTTISSITATGAAGGGNITSDGGAAVTERGVVWSTSSAPTVLLSTKTTDGSGTGTFTSTLASLTASTTYYVRAYATNSVGTAYGNEVTFTTSAPAFTCGTNTVLDIDNNSYNTVSIGTQCWMKENLKVTKYNDGTAIPLDASGGSGGNASGQTWSGLTTGARTVYAHDNNNLTTYGYLYNWYAASGIVTSGGSSTKNICPTGWHVPTDAEWTTLTTYLGGESVAGGKMKETGTTLWNSPNTDATNECGFSARPGGYRSVNGSFGFSRYNAIFWSASENVVGYARFRNLFNNNGRVVRSSDDKRYGLSVRCLRD